MSAYQATPADAVSRRPLPHRFDGRLVLRRALQFAQVAGLFALIGWVIWNGGRAMHYNWQWYRVPPLLYRVIDGELIWGPLVRGLFVTLQLAGVSMVLSVLIGFATACLRLSSSFAGRLIATGYLEAIRNTPLLVQLFLFYFVIAPIFGIDRFWSGVLCLSFFEGSFASEIIRGGIIAVDKGQYEAADAVGLSVWNKYRDIVIPQALPLILPPLTGVLISLIKHSAIVSVIAVAELTTEGLNIISDTFMAFEVWFVVAGIYLVLTIGLSAAVSLVEVRFRTQR